MGGNAGVIARAELVDVHYHMDRREIMSWTVFAEAFSWVIVGFVMRFLEIKTFEILLICVLILACLLTFSLLFNVDAT